MESKKINIITINLNNRLSLERTLLSIINQTFYDKINYIVIDGGSNDGSIEIIKKYKDKITLFISEKDNGIYNAMNKGVSLSNGEYCLFVNSGDELFSSDVIEKVYNQLDKDIVYGSLCINKKYKRIYPAILDRNYFLLDTLPHPSSFIRTSLLKVNPYNEDFKIISDWVFFYEEIILRKNISYKRIDNIVSTFYLGGGSSNVQLVNQEKKEYMEKNINLENLITVIIPCYNYGRYIKETLDSLKQSTYKNWTCVIINDGSTDNSEEIIFQETKDDRRFVYVKQSNRGLSATRNLGARIAKSKYIMYLDPDDKISPTYIESGILYLNSHDDCVLYYGNAKMFYDDGSEKNWNLEKYDYTTLLQRNHIYSSSIMRKSEFDKTDGYDENMKGYEDWEFLIRFLYGDKKVYKTDDVVFYYRRHNGSMDKQAIKYIDEYRKYIYNKNKEIYLNIYGKQRTNK